MLETMMDDMTEVILGGIQRLYKLSFVIFLFQTLN